MFENAYIFAFTRTNIRKRNTKKMESPSDVPLYKCPRCGEYPGAGQFHNAFITANDGGSVSCFKCGCLHHMCVSGIKVGSPGPATCPHCSGVSKRTIVFPKQEVVAHISKSSPVTPPQPEGGTFTDYIDMRLPYSIRSTHHGYK
jgi:hypothetical protein